MFRGAGEESVASLLSEGPHAKRSRQPASHHQPPHGREWVGPQNSKFKAIVFCVIVPLDSRGSPDNGNRSRDSGDCA